SGGPKLRNEMEQFEESSHVKQVALQLLRSLSVNEKNQIEISRAGAVPLLYQMVFSSNRDAQLNGASTLWNISVNTQNKKLIGETGGIELLGKLLLKTPDDAVRVAACG